MRRLTTLIVIFGVTMLFVSCSENSITSPEHSQITHSLAKQKTQFQGTCVPVAPVDPGSQMPLPNGKVLSEGEIVYWYDYSVDEPLVSGMSKWYIMRILNSEDGSQKLWGKAEIFVGTDSETVNPEINNDGVWEISWHGWWTTTPEIVCDAVGTGRTGDVKGMVAHWTYTFDFGLFQYNTEGYILK